MQIKEKIRKLDLIVRLIFTSIMIMNFIIEILVLIDLISLANYSFQPVVVLIYQVIIFIVFLFYYLLSLILNSAFKIKIKIKVLLGSFLINLSLLFLTYVFIYL